MAGNSNFLKLKGWEIQIYTTLLANKRNCTIWTKVTYMSNLCWSCCCCYHACLQHHSYSSGHYTAKVHSACSAPCEMSYVATLLESWGTTFLPYWQLPLIFARFISNFLCMCSNSMNSAHVILKWIRFWRLRVADSREEKWYLTILRVICL